jgi:outer membrane protein assembly factor BamE
VRDVLGSPLLTDPFHTDRWDYVFTIRRPGAPPQLRRVVVRFKDDVLASIEGGDDLPSEHDFVASIDTFKTARNAPPLVLSDEQVKALPVPEKPPAAEPVPPVPARTYPPLEPRS